MSDDSRDIGTPELAKQRRIIPRLRGGAGYAYDLYVADGSEIDRLLLAGRLDINQHSTLNSFLVMLHRANMLGPKPPAYEKRSASDPAHVSGKVAEAMAVVSKVLTILDKKIGQAGRRMLVDLAIEDKAPPDGDLTGPLSALREALDQVA